MHTWYAHKMACDFIVYLGNFIHVIYVYISVIYVTPPKPKCLAPYFAHDETLGLSCNLRRQDRCACGCVWDFLKVYYKSFVVQHLLYAFCFCQQMSSHSSVYFIGFCHAGPTSSSSDILHSPWKRNSGRTCVVAVKCSHFFKK